MVNKISKKNNRKNIRKHRDKHKLKTRNKLGKRKCRRVTRKKQNVLSGGGIVGRLLNGIGLSTSLVICLSLWLCCVLILIAALCLTTGCLGIFPLVTIPELNDQGHGLFPILRWHGLMGADDEMTDPRQNGRYEGRGGYYMMGGETHMITIMLEKLGKLAKKLDRRLCINLLKISLGNLIQKKKIGSFCLIL